MAEAYYSDEIHSDTNHSDDDPNRSDDDANHNKESTNDDDEIGSKILCVLHHRFLFPFFGTVFLFIF